MATVTCMGCFMECRRYEMVPGCYARPYPCTEAMMRWAYMHKNDPGDEFGFVVETDDEADDERLRAPERSVPTPPEVRELWVALIRDGYATKDDCARELGVTIGTVRKWLGS